MVKGSARTFAALAQLAEFSAPPIAREEEKRDGQDEVNKSEDEAQKLKDKRGNATLAGLRPEFHYNIQIHLPGNGTEETYLNIFNALRRTFK